MLEKHSALARVLAGFFQESFSVLDLPSDVPDQILGGLLLQHLVDELEFAVQFFKLEPEYLRPRAKIVLLMYDPPVPGDDLRRLAGMPPMLFPKQVLIRR